MPFLAAGTPAPTEDWDKETEEQFDYEHVDPTRRASSAADERGIWWSEQSGQQWSSDKGLSDHGISWEDDQR